MNITFEIYVGTWCAGYGPYDTWARTNFEVGYMLGFMVANGCDPQSITVKLYEDGKLVEHDPNE